MKRAIWLLLPAGVLGLALWYWNTRNEARETAPARIPPAPATSVPASAPAIAKASEPLAETPPPPESPLAAEAVGPALEALLGGKAVATYFLVDEFARRIAATVDNLGRSHAPPALWPVQPAPGRFTVDESAGYPAAGADNAARYTPLVLLAETVDMGSAADFYLRLLPLLEEEYRRLGYPAGGFHQRLMSVIGLLLATPEPEQPPRLELTEVKGSVPSERPWVRYRYADAALESLASGQKILLRIGVVNERRIKKKLTEFREAIAKRSQRR